MEVDDVELVRPAAHLVQHGHVRGQVRFQRGGIQPDGLVAHRDQLGPGVGIGAGEQGDLVPQLDQGVAEVGHHPLGAAIKPRRNRLVEGRYLCDLHFNNPRLEDASAPLPAKL